jgi:autonomous glycyl radical cofactor GrcA
MDYWLYLDTVKTISKPQMEIEQGQYSRISHKARETLDEFVYHQNQQKSLHKVLSEINSLAPDFYTDDILV